MKENVAAFIFSAPFFAEKVASPMGLEPTTSGLEVRRAIHCATETGPFMCCIYHVLLTD